MTKSWREILPVHPAADLFPLMSEPELRELGEDIRKNGLRIPIVLLVHDSEDEKPEPYRLLKPEQYRLLDGRNRLDAMELVGVPFELFTLGWNVDHVDIYDGDPYELVLSANIHRRHLTGEQKRELIAKVLKAKPEVSNNTIAKQVKADDKTVAKVRREMEGRSEIPNVETRTDTKGRNQPAKKCKNKADDVATLVEARERNPGSKKPFRELKTGETVWRFRGRAGCVPIEDTEEIEVESPDKILANFLDSVSRHAAVVRAYKKVFGVSALDEGQKGEARAAIGGLVTKWQSLERALAKPPNDDGLDLPAAMAESPPSGRKH